MAPLTWLVTGTTSGIGLALVSHIVERGDRVIATGRRAETRLGHLKQGGKVAVVDLDVSAPTEEIAAQVQKAWDVWGGVDVVLNNAGMSALKSCEEADDAFISRMFTVNLFGPMRVVSSVLPLMRARGTGGVLAFTSSNSAWMTPPLMAHYAASKAALSAYVDGLQKEVRGAGMRAVALECGGMPTSLGQPREGEENAHGFGGAATAVPEYLGLFGSVMDVFVTEGADCMPGDLAKLPRTVVDVIKREGVAAGRKWAVRVPLGCDSWDNAGQKCREELQLLEEWRDVAYSTDRDGREHVSNQKLLKLGSILEDD